MAVTDEFELEAIEPIDAVPPPPQSDADGEPEEKPAGRRRRGGPRATRAPRRPKVDHKLLGRQLVGIHQLLSLVTGQPIWAISDVEGEQLAKAASDIIAEYGLEASHRAILWGNLLTMVGIIYGPKAVCIWSQRKAAAKAKMPTKQKAPTQDAQPPTTTFDFSAAV